MSVKKNKEIDVSDNPLYHDTWVLLKKYRDVVWSLELSVQNVRRQFKIEYGSSIEDFLESIYVAGVDFDNSEIAEQARCIERTHKMLKLVDYSVNLLREKHKHGEEYYWILYYNFLSPQEYGSTEKIMNLLKETRDTEFSLRTYYTKRKEALCALSSILWGYTSKDCIDILDKLVPKNVI